MILLENALSTDLVNGCYMQTVNKTWHSQKYVGFWRPFSEHIFPTVPIIYSMSDFTCISTFNLQAPFVSTQTPLCKLSTHIFICASNTPKNKRSVGKLCTTTNSFSQRIEPEEVSLESFIQSFAPEMSYTSHFLFIFYCHLLCGSSPYLFFSNFWQSKGKKKPIGDLQWE